MDLNHFGSNINYYVVWNFSIILACKPGYHGRFCTEVCRYPNYGYLCQEGCTCSYEYCHHITGFLNSGTIFIACFSSAKLMLRCLLLSFFSLKWKMWNLGHWLSRLIPCPFFLFQYDNCAKGKIQTTSKKYTKILALVWKHISTKKQKKSITFCRGNLFIIL